MNDSCKLLEEGYRQAELARQNTRWHHKVQSAGARCISKTCSARQMKLDKVSRIACQRKAARVGPPPCKPRRALGTTRARPAGKTVDQSTERGLCWYRHTRHSKKLAVFMEEPKVACRARPKRWGVSWALPHIHRSRSHVVCFKVHASRRAADARPGCTGQAQTPKRGLNPCVAKKELNGCWPARWCGGPSSPEDEN